MDLRWLLAAALSAAGISLPAASPAPDLAGERAARHLVVDAPAPGSPAPTPDVAPTPPDRRRVVAAAAPPRPAAVPVPRAAARAPRRPAGPSWQERRGAHALALIRYPWQDLGWRISFHPARRGVLGVASHAERRIRVFVRPDQTARELAFAVAHEIGHALDFTAGTEASRARWLDLRGIDPATPWWGCDGCSDLATPAGDFAEVFAAWQVGPVDFRSRMAPLPDDEEMQRLAAEFAELTSA